MRRQFLLSSLRSCPALENRARRFRPAVEWLEERTALTTFTTTSPTTAGALPPGVSPVGGLVLDLVGVNGRRVVSQLSARSLFSGFFDQGTPDDFRGDPGTIGVQTDFSAEVLASLGGGLAEVAVRLTVSDGDTAPGDFDFGENFLLLNGTRLGSFSDVPTEETGPDGDTVLSTNPDGGFRNNRLDTGFFHSADPAFLQEFFATLSRDGAVVFQLADADPFDNFFDFTIGIEGELLDTGAPPAVVNPRPPPLPPPPVEISEPAPLAPPAAVVLPVAELPAPALAIALVQTGAAEAPTSSPALDPGPPLQPVVPVLGGGDSAQPPPALELPVSLLLAGSEEEAESPPEGSTSPDLVRTVSQATGAAIQVVASVAEGMVQAASNFTRQAAAAFDQVFLSLQTEAARIRLAAAEVPPVPVETTPPVVPPDLETAPAPAKAGEPPKSRAVIRTTVLMLSALLIHRSWSSSRASAAFLARRRRRNKKALPPSNAAERETS